MTTNDDDQYIRIAWRESPTIGAAIDRIAADFLKGHMAGANQEDRRAVARAMIRCYRGKVEAYCYTIEWRHEDGTDDLLVRPT